MPRPDAFVDYCIELLSPLGAVRARRMFGGHGLYLDELFFALIAYERLYLKADETSRERFRAAGCEPFVYDARTGSVALGYWSAPPDAMESPPLMQPWARLAVEAALRARAAKEAAALKRRTKARPAPAKGAESSRAAKARRSRARKPAPS
jgi:DNA transformation protein